MTRGVDINARFPISKLDTKYIKECIKINLEFASYNYQLVDLVFSVYFRHICQY